MSTEYNTFSTHIEDKKVSFDRLTEYVTFAEGDIVTTSWTETAITQVPHITNVETSIETQLPIPDRYELETRVGGAVFLLTLPSGEYLDSWPIGETRHLVAARDEDVTQVTTAEGGHQLVALNWAGETPATVRRDGSGTFSLLSSGNYNSADRSEWLRVCEFTDGEYRIVTSRLVGGVLTDVVPFPSMPVWGFSSTADIDFTNDHGTSDGLRWREQLNSTLTSWLTEATVNVEQSTTWVTSQDTQALHEGLTITAYETAVETIDESSGSPVTSTTSWETSHVTNIDPNAAWSTSHVTTVEAVVGSSTSYVGSDGYVYSTVFETQAETYHLTEGTAASQRLTERQTTQPVTTSALRTTTVKTSVSTSYNTSVSTVWFTGDGSGFSPAIVHLTRGVRNRTTSRLTEVDAAVETAFSTTVGETQINTQYLTDVEATSDSITKYVTA